MEPTPKTPKTFAMHYSYTSAQFLLICKSLDVHGGLLYKTFFEGHYGMWQDIIQTCNTPFLSGVRSAAFLWIPQRERKKKERGCLVVERRGGSGCLDRWKANYWMGFLAVCWEEQYWWHLQTANKGVRQKTRTAACTQEHIKKAPTWTAKSDYIYQQVSSASAFSHVQNLLKIKTERHSNEKKPTLH